MKLIVKKVLLIAFLLVVVIAMPCCDGIHDYYVTESDRSLAEAKTILTEEIGVESEIIVYKCAEYDYSNQYRWRYSDTDASGHVEFIQPQSHDSVIKSGHIKSLIDDAIRYNSLAMKLEALILLELFVVIILVMIVLQ